MRLSAWISVVKPPSVAVGPGNCESMRLSRNSQGYEDFLVICIYILFSFFQVRYILLIKNYGTPIIRNRVKCSDDRVSE